MLKRAKEITIKTKAITAYVIVLASALVGCETIPEKPTYKIQVGWTKEQVLHDSRYRDFRKHVMSTSTANGTVEVWSFYYDGSTFGDVYFDDEGKVIMYQCLQYC